MRRCHEDELTHAVEEVLVYGLWGVERAGMDGLEANRLYFVEAGERLARADDRVDALADGGWVVRTFGAGLADALDAALGKNGLPRHIKQAVLEGGAADIWDQDLHEMNLLESN